MRSQVRAGESKRANSTQSAVAAAPRRVRGAAGGRGLLIAGALIVLLELTPLGAKVPGGIAWMWVGMGLFILSMTLGRRPWISWPMAATLVAACGVLGGLELVYLPDRFVGELVRYNSYFKFSYPVWPVLWVGAWVVARGLWRARLAWPVALGVRLALLALPLCAAVYTTFAMPARFSMSSYGESPARRPTLDAYAFVANRPQVAVEAPLLEWIRRNVPAGERVAEAAWRLPATEAEAYKYQGRVASLAGRVVPIGWAHHEQQWRGPTAFAALDRRIGEVNALYEASTAAELRERAGGLGVGWIVFGVREAELYGAGALAALKAALPVAAAFPEGEPAVYIFKVERK